MEHVILAFSKDETAAKLMKMLDGSGYSVRAVCHSHAELMRVCSQLDEVLVIMGYKLHDTVADDVFEDLKEGQRLISIIKADKRELITSSGIFIVTLPINRQKLLNSIEMLCGSFVRRRKKGGRTPEEEKLILAAKGYLIEEHGMTEEQAHRFMQKRSMDSGAKFIDTARMILDLGI